MNRTTPTLTHGPACSATALGTGSLCLNPAMRGQTVCRKHGGKAPQALAVAQRRTVMEQAKQTAALLVTQYGGTYSADPLASLLHMVRTAAMAERAYAELVGRSEDLLLEVDYGKAGGHRAEPHPYVKLWNEERDRLVKFSKVALDAGVEQRTVEIAEAEGRLLVEVIEKAIEFLPPDEQQRVRASIVAQVRA